MNICVDCKHHENLTPERGAWYNHMCKANPLPKSINPVTGKTETFKSNDLGMVIFVDQQNAYCRDINTDGECKQYAT